MRTRELFFLAVVGCGDAPTEEGTPDRTPFENLVEQSSACTQDSDCTIVGDGCAALCGVSVNNTHAKEVAASAAALNAQYRKFGTDCHALCNEQFGVCDVDRCRVHSK